VLDAEQRAEERVAPRLLEHAVAGVDQDDREVAVRRAGRHVARVLHVPRRVGDDELALVGGEVAVRDVDRDALLALGLQAVDQQREVDLLAGRAVARGRLLRRREHVVVHRLRVVEQAADERRLAVVDAAAGEQPEHLAAAVAGQPTLDADRVDLVAVGHQK